MQNVEDYQIWFQLGQWYVRNRLKCKKLTDRVNDDESTNKTDCQDITEILLKVALNTISLTPKHICQIHVLYFVMYIL